MGETSLQDQEKARQETSSTQTAIIENYSNEFYYPEKEKSACLERLVIFPDGIRNRNGIPNSSVWIYRRTGHEYDPAILGPDVGCGITAFKIPAVDDKAADAIAEFLKDKKVLGRGNHFVDLCSSIISQFTEDDPEHNVLLIHTDGKQMMKEVPSNLQQAQQKMKDACDLRQELGNTLAHMLGIPIKTFGDWPHNTIEETEEYLVYRKGAIKTIPNRIHIMPAHIGSHILVYTVQEGYMPPAESLPHGTGRAGPINQHKVTEEKAEEVRKLVYVPNIIPSSSLKSEHPDCYNGFDEIFKTLKQSMIGLGHLEIKAYIGKL